MMKYVFAILCLLFLTNCSFSKGNKEQQVPIIVNNNRNDQLTDVQKNILLSIGRSDNVSLIETLKKAKTSDLLFSNSIKTPMGEALRANNVEAVKILIEADVEPFNLGEESSNFQKAIFQDNLQQNYKFFQHSVEASKINNEITESEAALMAEARKRMAQILSLIAQKKSEEAKGIFLKARLNIQIVESGLLFSLQKDPKVDESLVVTFIRNFLKESQLQSNEVQALYELELIRQFQLMFDDPQALAYLSNHKKLLSPLWNIDNSGILISPSLLFRIAWSAENFFVNPSYCAQASKQGCSCRDHSDNRFEISDLFLRRYNFPKSKFELVQTSQGKIEKSYRYFPRQIRFIDYSADNDIFFSKVSRFIKSNSEAEKSTDSWTVSIQGSRQNPDLQSMGGVTVELPNANDFCPAKWGETLRDPLIPAEPNSELPPLPDSVPSVPPADI